MPVTIATEVLIRIQKEWLRLQCFFKTLSFQLFFYIPRYHLSFESCQSMLLDFLRIKSDK